eukprot:gene5586-6275_t
MKKHKKLKAGDVISCVVEECIDDCLLIRYECKNGREANAVFRGILLDKNKPYKKRFTHASATKPPLTEDAVDLFVQSFRSTHISGKFLRNKNKPSCLILDEYQLNTGLGLGQEVVLEKGSDIPARKHQRSTYRSKFRVDDLYLKSSNTSSLLLGATRNAPKASRKSKVIRKIMQQSADVKLESDMERSLVTDKKLISSKGLVSFDGCNSNEAGASRRKDGIRLGIVERSARKTKESRAAKKADNSKVKVEENASLRTYSSPRNSMKRSVDVTQDRASSKDPGCGGKKRRTISKELNFIANDGKTEQTKKGSVQSDKSSKISTKFKRKGSRDKGRNKEGINDANEEERIISLHCDEPPLEYVTDEEQEDKMDTVKRRYIASEVRKQAEKILKGKITLLHPMSASQSLKGHAGNQQPIYFLNMRQQNKQTIGNYNAESSRAPSSSMVELESDNVVTSQITTHPIAHGKCADGSKGFEKARPEKNDGTRISSGKAGVALKDQVGCQGSHQVSLQQSKEDISAQNQPRISQKTEGFCGKKNKNDAINSREVVTDSENVVTAIGGILRQQEEAGNGDEKLKQHGVPDFDKNIISRCLENFEHESGSRKFIKAGKKGKGDAGTVCQRALQFIKERRVIDPLTYSRISFQRLIESARLEVKNERRCSSRCRAIIGKGKPHYSSVLGDNQERECVKASKDGFLQPATTAVSRGCINLKARTQSADAKQVSTVTKDLALHVALNNIRHTDILKSNRDSKQLDVGNKSWVSSSARHLQHSGPGLKSSGMIRVLERAVGKSRSKRVCKERVASKRRENIFKLNKNKDLKPSCDVQSGLENIERNLIDNLSKKQRNKPGTDGKDRPQDEMQTANDTDDNIGDARENVPTGKELLPNSEFCERGTNTGVNIDNGGKRKDDKDEIVGDNLLVGDDSKGCAGSETCESGNKERRKAESVTNIKKFKSSGSSQRTLKYPRVFPKNEARRKIYNKQKRDSIEGKKIEQTVARKTRSANVVTARGNELVEQMLRLNKNILGRRTEAGKRSDE